jgi:hypothetical protein
MRRRLIAVLLSFLAWPGLAGAQTDTRRTVEAVPLEAGERITLDGRFDEPVWERAMPATGFTQIDPLNGRPATEETEVRVAFSTRALYLGVLCLDSEPDKWIGYERRRDQFLPADDRFMWTIDTFLDSRSGYFFEMNPSGLMADSLFNAGIDNRQWDGIWNAKVHHHDRGWSIEIEIPFRSVNFDPNNDRWGINFQRTVRRKNEDSIWTGHARNQGLRRMTNAGLVTNIRNVTQGLGLDVKPYGLAAGESFSGTSPRVTGNGGVDVFYSPTPGLRSVLTVNTDFAQTEVDQRQVNLTRFNLFFPERRDFFLDGAPFFAFGSPLFGDLIVNPFFSRRIGLTASGQPQKIDFGTKLTGQAGQQDIGLLHVRTGDDDGLPGSATAIPGEDFTVARVRRRMLAQSYIGGLYTRRATPGQDDARHTTGLDFRLASATFRGNQNVELTGYYMNTAEPDDKGANAFGGGLFFPNDRWNVGFSARDIGEDFAPAIGFVTREGYRRYLPFVEFGPRPRGHRYVRRVGFFASGDLQTDRDNRMLNRVLDLNLFNLQFHSGDSFQVHALRFEERLDKDFDVSSTIRLPVGGRYTYSRYSVRGQTANQRVLALTGSYEDGGFYSGSRRAIGAGVTLRARPGLIVYTTAEWNAIDLPEGKLSTRLYRVVGETQFSPWIALVNNFQYDSVSTVLGWQSRFRWILRPGSDLYVVYTHNWKDDPIAERFATTDRRLASKVLYTHRF